MLLTILEGSSVAISLRAALHNHSEATVKTCTGKLRYLSSKSVYLRHEMTAAFPAHDHLDLSHE